MVGLDATVIVEGQDLVSLKLLEADMKTTLKPPAAPGGRQGIKIRVKVEDISLRDLQVGLLGLLSLSYTIYLRLKAAALVHQLPQALVCSSLGCKVTGGHCLGCLPEREGLQC